MPKALFVVVFAACVWLALAGPALAAPVTTPSVIPPAPDGADGWYVTAPSVTLNSSEVGVTYYSLSSATGPWTTYAGPIPMPEGVATLYFYSTDTANNAEAVVSLQLRVDTVAPEVAVSGVSAGAVSAAALTPTFSATDANLATVTATLDGAAFSSGSLVSAEGSHTLVVSASDSAGSTTTTTTAFAIDASAPSIDIQGVSEGALYAAPVTPTFSASDAHLSTVTATLDGAPFESGAAVSGQGAHSLIVQASDTAGNAATRTVSFTLDSVPPVVGASTSPASPDGLAGWFKTTPLITLSSSEPGQVSFSLDSVTDPFSTYTDPLPVAEGTHTVFYRATDTAGNASELASLTVGVDTVAPAAPGGLSAAAGILLLSVPCAEIGKHADRFVRRVNGRIAHITIESVERGDCQPDQRPQPRPRSRAESHWIAWIRIGIQADTFSRPHKTIAPHGR